MPTHLLTAALAVLGVLTVMPGPDVAIMTRHALAARSADALTRCGPWPGPRPGCCSGAR
ncbi:hypothetical protein ACFWHW_32020 [Streptomyces pharetrae]|uniref:hypothetical protein n=1 Tax=Streptomyces pharetrae TaxID=291370 RepID=UPI00364E9D4D